MDTEIKRLRLERGLTQEDVAKRLEVAPATVSRWEREPGRVTVPVLRNLAMILNCEPADLLASVTRRKRPATVEESVIVELPDVSGAGSSLHLTQEWLRLHTDRPVEDMAVMRVLGDAMRPTLIDGDVCVIDTKSGFEHSGLYCLGGPNLAYVRRLSIRVNGSDVLVSPDNPAFGEAAETVPLADIPIIGRVLFRCGRI